MEVLVTEYSSTIAVVGLVSVLLLIQLLVADVIGIIGGHTPGTSIAESHESLLFRATRAHANTNESIVSFLGLAVFSIAVGANATWINNLAVAYCVGRVGHMLCYYGNAQMLRSLFFGISILALFGMAGLSWAKCLDL